MSDSAVEFAVSSNGDRWFYMPSQSAGIEATVVHQTNPASGGARTIFPLGRFLQTDIGSPQHAALTELLATLATISTPYIDAVESGDKTAPQVRPNAPYEDGMQIIWDVLTREIIVIFRGSVTTLSQRFASRDEGIAAGEQLCRNAGWLEDDPSNSQENDR